VSRGEKPGPFGPKVLACRNHGTVYRSARLVESECRPRRLGWVDDANPSSGLGAKQARGYWCYRAGEAVTTPDESAGRDGRAHPGWPGPARADGALLVLDLGFDSSTLQTARAEVRACVGHARFPGGQVEDVVLAVHELAANAVCHGGGAGRLRVWNLAEALYCQVDDGDLMASATPEGALDQASLNSLPSEPGHGLWVVRRLADQMQSQSGPGGTSVLIRFDGGAARYFA